MQMSERQRRVLSLLERLGRGRDLPAAARRVWFVATRVEVRSTGRRRRSVSKW